MIKKEFFLLLMVMTLCGCSSSPSNNNSSSFDNPSSPQNESSFVEPSSSEINDPLSSYDAPSSSSNITQPSSSTTSSSSSSSEKVEYNPDGSMHLPVPSNEKKLEWSQTESKYDFSSSFPEGFNYIYGHKILDNPNFYADGGWKITIPNSQARLGLQTPRFETDLKIEIRLYLAGVYNSNNKVDEENPWIRIYGFDDSGKLVQTKEVLTPKNFYQYANNKTPINFYMSGENVSYLEMRFASAPYKASQCYNFGIKEIGFKTFPYAYEE